MSDLDSLINFAEITMGQSPSAEDVNEKSVGLPLLNGPTEFTDRYPVPVQFTSAGKKVCKKDDLLFCVRGSTTGRMNYADQPYAIGRGLASIRGKNGYSTPYIRAIIEYKLNDLLAAATGSTFPNVGKDLLAGFLVPKLSPEDAQVIGKIITNIEDKIYNNKQTNETLEGMAQAIFKSWFVDFDPVRAKVEVLENGGSDNDARLAAMQAISGKSPEDLARLKTQKPESYAELAATADAFPSAFTTSPLGNIPEGWRVNKIEDIAKIIKGKSYKSSELAESSTALVTLKSFNRGGGYRLDGLKEYTGTYKTDQEVFAGDLIIAYTDVTQAADVIGKPAMVISDSRYDHLVISLDVAVVRPDKDSLKYYLHGLAQTEQFQQHTNAHSTGTTVLHLSKNAVPEYEFALPDESLIKAYEKMVKSIFILINESIGENQSLTQTRDTLLPKLLSGEIDVSKLGGE